MNTHTHTKKSRPESKPKSSLKKSKDTQYTGEKITFSDKVKLPEPSRSGQRKFTNDEIAQDLEKH